MKNLTYLNLLLLLCILPTCITAQNKKESTNNSINSTLTEANIQSLDKTGYIRCYTTEHEQFLKQKYPNRRSKAEFENWLAPKIKETKERIRNGEEMPIINIPVIFHVITNGSSSVTNLSKSRIESQVDQLNLDFGNQAGSSYSSATDSGIRYCLAKVDENGSQLSENGIDRVTNRGDGPFSENQMENIKSATIWDPTKYMNIWVARLEGGLLGYAVFPSNSGLADVGYSGSTATNDGVVVGSQFIGSLANPNSNGNYYGYGRTLTHEVGHWFALYHSWGNAGGCSDDDYCNDTPNTSTANFQCPTGTDSCSGSGNDMIENYMDYTDDQCMNTFTEDQVARMITVMANATRRVELKTSTACSNTTANTSTFNIKNTFSIYPNPANSVLNIKTSDNNIPNSYKIYNMLGQLIKAVDINSASDLSVNTSAFSNGMYFIKIAKDNNSISIPFIKE